VYTRFLTTVIGAPLALALVAWPGGVPATVLAAVVLSLAYGEYAAMCAAAGYPCRIWWGTAWIVLFVIAAQGRMPVPDWLPEAAMFLGWAFLIVETGRPDRRPVAAIGSTLLGVLWIGGLGSCLVRLRFWDPAAAGVSYMASARPLIAVLVIVWSLDVFAYLVGKLFGRNKIAPQISPNKTIEGALAGFFAAAVAGLLTSGLAGQTRHDGVILGAAIAVAGQVGDLFESAVKRELGTKDSGSALPGHGGWLDRIDSLLFASGVAAWWLGGF